MSSMMYDVWFQMYMTRCSFHGWKWWFSVEGTIRKLIYYELLQKWYIALGGFVWYVAWRYWLVIGLVVIELAVER